MDWCREPGLGNLMCECLHSHQGDVECPWPLCPCAAFVLADLDILSEAVLADMERRGEVQTSLYAGQDVGWGDGLVWVVAWLGNGSFSRDRREAIIYCWLGNELAA